MMSTCFTWFPIGGLREPKVYYNLVDFTRMWNFTWRLSDCEELVGLPTGDDLNDLCANGSAKTRSQNIIN